MQLWGGGYFQVKKSSTMMLANPRRPRTSLRQVDIRGCRFVLLDMVFSRICQQQTFGIQVDVHPIILSHSQLHLRSTRQHFAVMKRVPRIDSSSLMSQEPLHYVYVLWLMTPITSHIAHKCFFPPHTQYRLSNNSCGIDRAHVHVLEGMYLAVCFVRYYVKPGSPDNLQISSVKWKAQCSQC